MTKAKYLQGESRTELTKASFQNKILEMTSRLKAWKMQGARDNGKWPETLAELREWDEPEKGIYEWTSPNVTSRGSKTYGDLVKQYWQLQTDAEPFLKGDRLDTLQGAKKLNRALAQQNTRLTWQIMELRDALARADPKNEALSRLPFA
jgi:hypothetical protein